MSQRRIPPALHNALSGMPTSQPSWKQNSRRNTDRTPYNKPYNHQRTMTMSSITHLTACATA
eukprot:227061-Heterocapsa_arctica.AAC.1